MITEREIDWYTDKPAEGRGYALGNLQGGQKMRGGHRIEFI